MLAKECVITQETVALHQTLSNLAIDSDIKVSKFDKEKGVAILDTKDYYGKLNCIISNNFKFHKVDKNTKIHPITDASRLTFICFTFFRFYVFFF